MSFLCESARGSGPVAKLTHLSLFSGIGGIDLAAEWAGFETVAFVERDPFCQKVLAKHWPGILIYDKSWISRAHDVKNGPELAVRIVEIAVTSLQRNGETQIGTVTGQLMPNGTEGEGYRFSTTTEANASAAEKASLSSLQSIISSTTATMSEKHGRLEAGNCASSADFQTIIRSCVSTATSLGLCMASARINKPPIFDDVTTFEAAQFRGVDLVSGGFPCQDVSNCSTTKAGVLDGQRSALWFEMLRIVRECRPMFVLAENVPALRVRGADRVMYGLESEGYTVEAFVVGAGHAGAPHQRKRVFIVGADSKSQRRGWRRVEDTAPREDELARLGPTNLWRTVPIPAVRGVAHGVPRRLDGHRLRALGNAVVPAQVYPILKAIAETFEVAA